jgi:hypothetical protein
MYTLARGGLRQRVFAGECSVMHQWHPALSSSKHLNLLQFIDSMHVTAVDDSPFLWNGSRVDVDGHILGTGDDDTWGLHEQELLEEVAAANAR